jgi:hypothetical protein
MEALAHDKPHKHHTYAEHCKKAFVLGTSTEHYWCWKFWSKATRATQILGAAFFKHKYLTNLSATPDDLVIVMVENLPRALETSIPQHLCNPTIQALKDLSEVFTDVAHKYSNNPAMHTILPGAPPTPPHQEPMASPMVPPTLPCTLPPRVHSTMISLRVPSILPTCSPSRVQKIYSHRSCPVWIQDRTMKNIN